MIDFTGYGSISTLNTFEKFSIKKKKNFFFQNKPAVKFAILPINVLSPVRITTPIHEPINILMRKKKEEERR